MKKNVRLSFAVSIIMFCTNVAVQAQNDSARLDAGVLKFRRPFTQSITIKGEDLEKMPFSNLGEAINAWLSGAYSNASTLVYVVDGNLVSDVNAYSVYDIEEVVAVLNAAADMNSATSQQRMVLITTRKSGRGRSGIRVAGQSGLVNTDFNHALSTDGLRSNNNWYHQYYAGGYLNVKNMSMGISADWLRDVQPSEKADNTQVITPYNLDRIRLNGYFTVKLGTRNDIDVRVNYTPEQIDSTVTLPSPYYGGENITGDVHMHQRLFIPSVRWHSGFLPGWNNDLQVTYLSSIVKADAGIGDVGGVSQVQNPNDYFDAGSGSQDSRHIYVRDYLSYTLHAGGWTIEPSVNASYEHVKQSSTQGTVESNYGNNLSASETSFMDKGHILLLTPSVDAGYKEFFDLKGGFLADLGHSSVSGQASKNIFPFVSGSAQVLRWGHSDHPSHLQLFASYAKRTNFYLNDYGLTDLSSGTGLSVFYSIPSPILYSIDPDFQFTGASATSAQIPAEYWVWETGASLSLWKDRLQVNYNFERRNYTTPSVAIINAGTPVEVFPEIKSSTHFLGVSARILTAGDWQWRSGLNLAVMTGKSDSSSYLIGPHVGDVNTGHLSWTGGWVHRLQYRDFLAGADLLYHFNELLTDGTGTPTKTNSLLLQNIYIGYRLHVKKTRVIELYLDSRGLWQSAHSDLADRRRYYGAGGKMAI